MTKTDFEKAAKEYAWEDPRIGATIWKHKHDSFLKGFEHAYSILNQKCEEEKNEIANNANMYIKKLEKKIAELKHAYSIDKWISVKDRLPEERLLGVLLCNMDAPEYNQHIFQATWFGQVQAFRREIEGEYMGTITHWQPLPELPKP